MSGLTAQVPVPLTSVFPSAVFANLTQQCLSSSLPKPTLFGAEILEVTSSLMTNYTASAFLPPLFFNADPPIYEPVEDLSFCNVTVTYTHPGQIDNINVNLWLPLSISDDVVFESHDHDHFSSKAGTDPTSPAWNGVLLSHGGGGFSTCLPDIVSHSALTQGYALSRTDGGHRPMSLPDLSIPTVESWVMLSPGNVNLYAFQDFASVALHDMAIISKAVVNSFYHMPARKSYFQGCSTGGRQALMLAQRYPTDYDGILAAAPALYFPKLMVSAWYGQTVMQALDSYPKPCEFEALTQAAIEECDILDGVLDGLISNESACTFDPFLQSNPKLHGEKLCTMQYADEDQPVTEMVNISAAASHLAWHLWGGAPGSTTPLNWHTPTHSTPLLGHAATKCFRANNTCIPAPNPLAADWLRLFLYKDPSLSASDILSRVSTPELQRFFHQSSQEYDSLIGTSDPDLSAFATAGGKLLLWHGTSDEAIPYSQSEAYYESALSFFSSSPSVKTPSSSHSISNVTDFFRFFPVPGVGHCGGGEGHLPLNALHQLRQWVENDVPPETLHGETFSRKDGVKMFRDLCMFPKVARLKGQGWNVSQADSFECADRF